MNDWLPMLSACAPVLPFVAVEWTVVLTAVRYLRVQPGARVSVASVVVRVLGATSIVATFLSFLWVNRRLHGGVPGRLESPLVAGFVGTHLLLVAGIFWMIWRRDRSSRR